jgi:hypothetical protein
MTKSAGPALKEFYEEYGERVRFITLYVREAHPGEVYSQTLTAEQKMRHARDYAARDAIPWTVVVDDPGGTLHRQLDEKPDSAYVIGTDGCVLFRTLWSNHRSSMRDGLEAAAAGVRPADAEREPRFIPMMSGLGSMYEVLDQAGDVARRDALREVPPMFALARTADLFKPLHLSPLARAAAATGVFMAGAVALIGALRNR